MTKARPKPSATAAPSDEVSTKIQTPDGLSGWRIGWKWSLSSMPASPPNRRPANVASRTSSTALNICIPATMRIVSVPSLVGGADKTCSGSRQGLWVNRTIPPTLSAKNALGAVGSAYPPVRSVVVDHRDSILAARTPNRLLNRLLNPRGVKLRWRPYMRASGDKPAREWNADQPRCQNNGSQKRSEPKRVLPFPLPAHGFSAPFRFSALSFAISFRHSHRATGGFESFHKPVSLCGLPFRGRRVPRHHPRTGRSAKPSRHARA